MNPLLDLLGLLVRQGERRQRIACRFCTESRILQMTAATGHARGLTMHEGFPDGSLQTPGLAPLKVGLEERVTRGGGGED